MMITLLDVNGKFFASSIDIDAMMKLMRTRWAGTVVDERGRVLFDIKSDRAPNTKDNIARARAEADLAWTRYCAD